MTEGEVAEEEQADRMAPVMGPTYKEPRLAVIRWEGGSERMRKTHIRCNALAVGRDAPVVPDNVNTYPSPCLFDLSEYIAQLGYAEHGIYGVSTLGRKKRLERQKQVVAAILRGFC